MNYQFTQPQPTKTVLKRNDTLGKVEFTVPDTALLVGANVKFLMEDTKGNLLVSAPADSVNTTTGKLEYNFKAGDTYKSGNHRAEFRIYQGEDFVKTYPETGYLQVMIHQNIDGNRESEVIIEVSLLEEFKTAIDQRVAKAEEDASKVNVFQAQIDQMTIEGDSSVEAAQARVKSDGTSFTTLKHRLDSSDAQLAHTASKVDSKEINVLYPPAPLMSAKGDYTGISGTNDTTAIQNIANTLISGQKLVIPPANYLIETLNLNLPDGCEVDCQGVFYSNTSGIAIILGTSSKLRSGYNVKGLKVSSVWNQTNQLTFRPGSIGVQIINVSMSKIEIKDVYGFETGIQQIGTASTGCALNDIYIGRLRNNKQSVRFSTDGGWVTETTYHGGSYQHGSNLATREGLTHVIFDLNPTFNFDNIHFFRPAFESTVAGEKSVIIPVPDSGKNGATRCGFFMPRNEGSNVYDFGGAYNYIYGTFTNFADINDNGYLNEYNIPDVLFKAGSSSTRGIIRGQNRSGNASPVFEALSFNKTRAWSVDGNGRMWLTSNGILIGGGNSSPEGVITAPQGSLWLRNDGGLGTSIYVKEGGTGNTGWSALHPFKSGTTANRPLLPPNPYMYFDTTLNKPIYHRGSNVWVDANGVIV